MDQKAYQSATTFYGLIEREVTSSCPHLAEKDATIAARLNQIEDICEKVPGLAGVGGIYTVIAQKTGKEGAGVRHRRSD